MHSKYFALLPALLIAFLLQAQVTETLTPLTFNPSLTGSKTKQDKQHKYLTEKGQYVVFTDTLSLPFVDDFSRNRFPGYRWKESNTTDTFVNVIGGCLGNEGITTESITVLTDTAWDYTYDTTTHTIDSTPQPGKQFTSFGLINPANCFINLPQQVTYWSPYYRYTFDSTGKRTDSLLISPPTQTITLAYAPVVYFTKAPAGTLWADNYAFLNNTFPTLPPTIGVATLDGLNDLGLPYNNTSNTTYGQADYLTSKPINLNGLSEADSVYLSFYYEPRGLGEFPDFKDSLIVEFKDIGGVWQRMWSTSGFNTFTDDSAFFRQVLVLVPDRPIQNSFFHNVFQFRFRNKASLYGMLDHWHIDYVRFDKNRSAVDTVVLDASFVYEHPTVLKNYTLMPADHFTGTADLADTLRYLVRNLDPNADNNPPATNFVVGAREIYPAPAIVMADVAQTFNASSFRTIETTPSTSYNINTTNFPLDSLVLEPKVFISPNDALKLNDTLVGRQVFGPYLAYDDGTAEAAYGITGVGIKKFAYEFTSPQPDTLAGFQVMFTQIEENVSNLVFNFNIWDSLTLNDFAFVDSPIITIDSKRPFYVDSINGFTTYVFDTPVIVPSRIYIGWSQTDERNLQIGYDLNSTLGHAHMYAYKNAVWLPTQITTLGSPMIRAIYDSNFWSFTTGVKNAVREELQVELFPNPAGSYVSIRCNMEHLPAIEVYDILGNKVQELQSRFIALGNYTAGLYLLRITDPATGRSTVKKLVKN